jgi:hypothetical protein
LGVQGLTLALKMAFGTFVKMVAETFRFSLNAPADGCLIDTRKNVVYHAGILLHNPI